MSEKYTGSLVPGEGEPSMDSSAEIVNQTLENPLELEGNNGPIICGTDKGFDYKEHNEDALVVAPDSNSFAIIDGVGGEAKGREAALVMARVYKASFMHGKSDFEYMQLQAHKKMKEFGLYEDGACYLAIAINDRGELEVAQAGDVRLIVINRGNNGLRFETEDENLSGAKHIVVNAVSGKDPGVTTRSTGDLITGDRIIIGSDGLWDNLSSGEVLDLIEGKDIKDAFQAIEEETRKRMQSTEGKPDNRTVFIYDYDKK